MAGGETGVAAGGTTRGNVLITGCSSGIGAYGEAIVEVVAGLGSFEDDSPLGRQIESVAGPRPADTPDPA